MSCVFFAYSVYMQSITGLYFLTPMSSCVGGEDAARGRPAASDGPGGEP